MYKCSVCGEEFTAGIKGKCLGCAQLEEATKEVIRIEEENGAYIGEYAMPESDLAEDIRKAAAVYVKGKK